ncbi:hypothetical protein JCM8115_006269 [Rhodotorula mucilaginosa]
MDASDSPSQSSPRSTRSDLVRSFTTSSDTSASERVAALREARALRRRQREADADSPAEEAGNGVDAGAFKRSTVACAEVTPAVTSAVPASTATPRLRIQSTSDRSYSPSLSSTPSKSKSSETATTETTSGDANRRIEQEMVTPPTDSRADHASSPISSAPTTPTPATKRSSSPSPSPASSVSIAGGLLERLKAQRAARVSTETVHPPRHLASASELGGSTAPASPKWEPNGAGVSLATDAPSSSEIQRRDRSPPAGQHDTPFARPEAMLNASPPRPTSGVCSSVLSSPDGEEFDHAFHPLSDVMEQSERSSLSTWQTQLGESGLNHRAPASQLDAQSNRSLHFPPSTTNPWTRSSRREERNGTTQALAAAREGQSESSASSIFSDTAGDAARRAESAFEQSHAAGAAAAPSTNGRGALLAFEEGTKPIRRYCVLTEEALEYRPTDQSGLVERSIAFKTVDCVEVEYEPSVQAEHLASLIPTPHFSTARGVGNPHRFAVTATSDWSLTPPGSFFSETRGTVRSWTRDNARPHPSLPLSAAPSVPSITQQPWRQAAGEDDSARKLLDLDRSSTRSSAMRRLERSETPPPLPPKTARYLAHSPIPGPFSRERMPRATFGRDSTASTPVPSSSLLEELRELLAVLEVDDLRKKAKSSRYQRLRERLGAFKERLASDKSSTMSPHDAHLAEKVEYLMAANDTLLRKQELLESALGDKARVLEAEERELSRRVDACLRELAQAGRPSRERSVLGLPRQADTATLTTRAGVYSASERAAWDADLERFKDEAVEAKKMLDASAHHASSPGGVPDRQRETANRRPQSYPAIPIAQNASRDPVGLFAEDDLLSGARTLPPRDPFAASGVVQAPTPRPPPLRADSIPRPRVVASSATSPPSVRSWAASDISRVERTLRMVLESFEAQSGTLAEQQAHQNRISQVVGELAKWVAEDRSIRDLQFRELVHAIESVIERIGELPGHISAPNDASGYSPPPPAPLNLPTVDTDSESLTGQDEGAAGLNTIAHSSQPRKCGGIINPQSSFARAQAQAGEKQESGVKGPRMPVFRLWDPVARQTAQRDHSDGADAEQEGDETIGADAVRPVMEALKHDARLGQALEAIAAGSGEDIDPAAISMAVLEILATMREIAKKQDSLEAKEAAEKARNHGLTDREKAELETKRAEIARIETRTLMSEERTARINEMVAKLAERTDKTDRLLQEIAKNVQDGKKTRLDPALSEEVKKLLSGVRTGVDEHVKDFRGQLTTEIQRMFKEVGKLRDEKKALQSDIADLLAFQAKHGGKVPAAAAPSETSTLSATSPKSGMPTTGFFGPRSPAP